MFPNLESNLDLSISSRGNCFQIKGFENSVVNGETLLKRMYRQCFVVDSERLSLERVHLYIQEIKNHSNQKSTHSMSEAKTENKSQESILIDTPRKSIESRGENQISYIKQIEKYDINFGIGPAGTGKTYLAVACAVAALKQEKVSRIILVRPAVEAGEKLGFLPGDLNEKVNPYLRPLYDALYEMLGFETVDKMLEKQIIEIVDSNQKEILI